MTQNFTHPLMYNNFKKQDFSEVIKLLKSENPKLTQGKNVNNFEKMWSKWLGVKYSVFVNSGSSANLISISALKLINKNKNKNQIIVPALTWSSDISSVIFNNYKPVLCDINLKNLSINLDEVKKKINKKTLAVFITHAQGFNGLTKEFINYIKKKNIYLIEDVCESHGAKLGNIKLGNFGEISNFSFYYAHHMSTIEGGMICTNSKEVDNYMKSIRSHGFLREINDKKLKKNTLIKYKDLNSKFIFLYPGFNFRNTEIGAIIGISQLKKLNKNIALRNRNNKYFVSNIDSAIFFTDFDMIGSSNYAFNLILRKKNKLIFQKLCNSLDKNNIEYRVGSVGGGNQLRQPYLKNLLKNLKPQKFPLTDHMHFFSLYIGNYPDLDLLSLKKLVKIINNSVI